jgi:hypothetical protein
MSDYFCEEMEQSSHLFIFLFSNFICHSLLIALGDELYITKKKLVAYINFPRLHFNHITLSKITQMLRMLYGDCIVFSKIYTNAQVAC